MPSAVNEFISALKKQPQLLFGIALVAIFLGYMDRAHKHDLEKSRAEDMVAVQRIEQCHSIQEQSNVALIKLSTSLDSQKETFEDLSDAIKDLRASINDHDDRITRLLNELERHARDMERRKQ